MLARLMVVGFISLFALAGCGSFKRLAVGTTGGLLYEATPALEAEADFTLFKESVLSNIKIMEGLLALSPNDRDLLASLVKAYAGYGYGVYETMDLKDMLLDKSDRVWRERALLFYSRAIAYGERYFALHDVSFKELLSHMRENRSSEYLNDHLDSDDKRDLEAVLFSAQALAGIVNYNRDNMVMVSQLPIAKTLFDWACAVNDKINYGACDLFFGAYHAGRPRMLGGDTELGLKHFEKALAAFPDNYLIHAALLQYYIAPTMNEKRFAEVKAVYEEVAEKFESDKYWNPLEKSETKPYALYQAIGLARIKVFIETQKEWL